MASSSPDTASPARPPSPKIERPSTKVIVGVLTSVIATFVISTTSLYGPSALTLASLKLAELRDCLSSVHMVPGWLLAGVGFVLLLSCGYVVGTLFKLLPWKAKPAWHAYSADTFSDLLWRWSYRDKSIESLTPHCPHCDIELLIRKRDQAPPVYVYFVCDNCGKTKLRKPGTYAHIQERTTCKIERNIRSGDWKQRAEGATAVSC